MNIKMIFFATAVCGTFFAKVSYAESIMGPLSNSDLWPKFYAGVSAGVQRLSGKRGKLVDYQSSPGNPFGPRKTLWSLWFWFRYQTDSVPPTTHD